MDDLPPDYLQNHLCGTSAYQRICLEMGYTQNCNNILIIKDII